MDTRTWLAPDRASVTAEPRKRAVEKRSCRFGTRYSGNHWRLGIRRADVTSVATPQPRSWEQARVEPSPASRRWGEYTVHLRHAPPIQSATEAASPGGAMPLTARPGVAGGPANGVSEPARSSEGNGSSNASAGAPLGPCHHLQRPATRKVRWTGERSTRAGMTQD